MSRHRGLIVLLLDAVVFATYLIVALLHTRSIKRVSLAEALKVQE